MSKRKIIDFYFRHEWTLAGLAFMVLICMSIIGFNPCWGAGKIDCGGWTKDSPESFLDVLFFTLQMLVLNYGGVHGEVVPCMIQVARFGLPLLASATIIREIFKIAALRGFPILIWNWNRHIVFCGGGDQARSLIRQYLKNGHRKIVVIDFDDTLDTNELKHEGVVILRENATFASSLLKARVKQASCVYIMAGSDQTNVAIFSTLEKVIGAGNPNGEALKNCFLHIYDPTLKNSLDGQLQKKRHSKATPGWEIRTFCTWENAARVLFTNHGPHLNTWFADDKTPHILILGHSWLAEQLIVQGARLGHYSGGRKLRITYVDENAESLRDRLHAQFPALDPKPATHMAWHPKELDCLPVINTDFIAKAADSLTGELYARIIESAPISAAYICHSDNEQALRTLAALQANLATPATRSKTKIVVCDMQGLDLAYLGNSEGHSWIETFDAIAAGATLKKNEPVIDGFREDWAKGIHQFYFDKYPGTDPWEKLSNTMRDSNRECADHLKIKLDWLKPSSESDLSEKLQTHRMELMRMEHERWNAERFMSGWRYCERPESKDGEEEAKNKKQNWNLCTFDKLSPSEQEKDKDIVWDITLKLYPRYRSEVLND